MNILSRMFEFQAGESLHHLNPILPKPMRSVWSLKCNRKLDCL